MGTTVRSFGHFFRTDAVAGGDHATAEIDPELREEPRTSADGRWWWDGRRWLATSTPDGLWQWDGRQWRPTIELRGVRPRDLATTLAFLAEDRYVRAAAILVDRAREWRPQGEARDLVGRAVGMRHGLLRVEAALRAAGAGPPRLFRRWRARSDEREHVDEEQALLDARYRTLLARLGRRAPRPTVKEADDVLEVARLLDQRATRITEALVAADDAERSRANAIEAARQELQAAEAAHRAAIAAAALAVERAREERGRERRALRRRLREALAPPVLEAAAPGSPRNRGGGVRISWGGAVGPLRAGAASVETPAGRLPLTGASAAVGSAIALWRGHRDRLEDLLLLESPEAEAFLGCLSERRRDQFLLLATRSRTLLWRCPPGDEKPLRQFATAVNRLAARATGPEDERLRTFEALREELAALAGDEIARARTARDRVEADERGLAAVEAAWRRLQQARAEPPELMAARRRAAAEVQAVSTPPPPLVVAQ
jgi:hypothetical protein